MKSLLVSSPSPILPFRSALVLKQLMLSFKWSLDLRAPHANIYILFIVWLWFFLLQKCQQIPKVLAS